MLASECGNTTSSWEYLGRGAWAVDSSELPNHHENHSTQLPDDARTLLEVSDSVLYSVFDTITSIVTMGIRSESNRLESRTARISVTSDSKQLGKLSPWFRIRSHGRALFADPKLVTSDPKAETRGFGLDTNSFGSETGEYPATHLQMPYMRRFASTIF